MHFQSLSWIFFFVSFRYRQEVVVHEDQIFTFGGSTSHGEAFDLETVSFFAFKLQSHWALNSFFLKIIQLPVFDLKTNKWKFIETLPDANLNCKNIRNALQNEIDR